MGCSRRYSDVKHEKIWSKFEFLRISQDSVYAKQLIGELLCDEISSAIKIVQDARNQSNMSEIINMFYNRMNGIIREQVIAKKLLRSTPDKVFRQLVTEKDGVYTFVPASSAIEIVLRHNYRRNPPLKHLRSWWCLSFKPV